MNERLFKRAALLALGCVIVASSAACGSAASNNKAPTVAVNGKITTTNQVQTTTPKVVDATRRITADGRLAFVDDRKLTFRTSGNVGQVNVKELDKVTKGQVLAKLDTTSLEQAVLAAELGVKTVELAQKSAQMDLKQAESAVKSAEVDLKQVQDNVKSAGIDLRTATNNLAKISYPYTYSTFTIDIPTAIGSISNAQLNLNLASSALQPGATNYGDALAKFDAAQTSLIAALQLLGKGTNLSALVGDVSQSRGGATTTTSAWTTADLWTLTAAQLAVDKAQMAVTTAQNAVDKTALTADNSRTALSKTQVAVERASNDMLIAKNNLNIARTNLENAIITAPIGGVVARVSVKEGDYLSPATYSTTVAIEIVDSSRMELNIPVYELDVAKVKLGQKVAITVDAMPGEHFEGVVTAIGTLPGSATGIVSYEVKIAFEVPPRLALRSGMGATADIPIE